MAGRPSSYNKKIGDKICERIACDEKGLEEILEEIRLTDGWAPGIMTIWRWRDEFPEFKAQYKEAREMQASLLHDRAQKYAREPLIGRIETTIDGPKGVETQVKVCDNVERSKLLVQTTLKRAGQLDHKRYGDKIQQEISGVDGKPIEAAITVQFVRSQNADGAGNS